MRPPKRSVAIALILGSLGIGATACTQVEESESTYSPTKVTPITGNDDIQQVTFTAEAAKVDGLQTEHVFRTRGARTAIPYAALIYDEEGDTFTYVSPRPLTYVRTAIRIDHIVGNTVVLEQGPPVGTAVVTTGAAEVYSAEFGVEE